MNELSDSLNVLRYIPEPPATFTPPRNSNHPVPARNPPTTGYGMNRARLPRRNEPITRNVTPVSTETTTVAATTVRNARLRLPVASRAARVATTPRTAAAASCTLPTTPRLPPRQARIAIVIDAPASVSPIPSGRNWPRYPP